MKEKDYQGSEQQKSREGREFTPEQKLLADKTHAKEVADKILSCAREGKIRRDGKEYPLPDAKKEELRRNLYSLIETGVKALDTNEVPGLSRGEWQRLEQVMHLETDRWINEAAANGIREAQSKIENVNFDNLSAHQADILRILTDYAAYQKGDWAKIHQKFAAMLGIESAYLTPALSRQLGEKIQALIEPAVKRELGKSGKIGPKTLIALAEVFGISRPDEEVKPIVHAPETKFSPDRKPGFGRLIKPSEAEQTLRGFSNKQKMEMLKAAAESRNIAPEQGRRLAQIGILQTILQSVRDDIENSRTWSEWMQQAFTERSGTTEGRRQKIDSLMAELPKIAEAIQKDPTKTLDQLLSEDFKKILRAYKLHDRTETKRWGKGEVAEYKVTDGLLDANGRLKEPKTYEELQAQYKSCLQWLRGQKNYEAAQRLVEENLLNPHFEKKRQDLAANVKQESYDKAYARISKMITPETMQQWRQQGMTPEQAEEYKQTLVKEDARRNMNSYIAKLNNGIPFARLTGADRDIMLAYKDMMGTGEWYNLSDQTWDTICEELVINAPLIILSGGLASAGRAALSAGARAVIASGRFASIGLKIAEGSRAITATSKLGKALYWSGRGAGMLAEGAAFETVHTGLQGKWILDMPDWGKRMIWSTVTLGTFHFSGKQAGALNGLIAKHLTKVTDKSIAAGIQKLLVTKNVEAATMLFTGALQHGAYEGNFEDWHLVDQALHAYMSVGALHIAGKGVRPVIEAGTKKFVAAAVEIAKQAEIGPRKLVEVEGRLVPAKELGGLGTFNEQLQPNQPAEISYKDPLKLSLGPKSFYIIRTPDGGFLLKNIETGHGQVLQQGETTIGRGKDNSVTIENPAVSRHHLKISIQGDRLTFMDLGSKYGTRLEIAEKQKKEAPRHTLEGLGKLGPEISVVPKQGPINEIATNRLDQPQFVKAKNGVIAYGTDEGVNYKPINEDAVVVNTGKNAFASIDGMGGMGAKGPIVQGEKGTGEQAAQILAEEFQKAFAEGTSIEEAQIRAHQRMAAGGVGEGGACYITGQIKEGTLEVNQAGDVKLMIIDREGNVRFETTDQTLPVEGYGHVVVNAVQGTRTGTTTKHSVQLQPGDRIVAGSDGLFDNYTAAEVAQLIHGKPIHEAMRILNDGAKQKMANAAELQARDIEAKPDNINVIIYDYTAPARARPEVNVGDRVYVKRRGSALETGWRVESVNQDGTYELVRPERIGILDRIRGKKAETLAKRKVPREELWRSDEIENPRDPQSTLEDPAADFERRKIFRLKNEPILSEGNYKKLFGQWELAQQNVGNCYLISVLNSLRNSPHFEAIVRTSLRVTNEGWEIRIPLGDENGRVITVTQADLGRQPNPNKGKLDWRGKTDKRDYLEPVKASLGFQILEAAFIKQVTGGDTARSRIEGGFGHQALLELTGENCRKIKIDSRFGRHAAGEQTGATMFQYAISKRFAEASPEVYNDLVGFLDRFHAGKVIATANTPPAVEGHHRSFRIEGVDHVFANNHAYSIVGTVPAKLSPDGVAKVHIQNPWNTGITIELTYEQFAQVFSQISGAEMEYSRWFNTAEAQPKRKASNY